MEIENKIPCIVICQSNFLEIYNNLKQKYAENVSLVSLENSKWIYTNENYYETIIKESSDVLGVQDKCYNIVSSENSLIASPLGTITLCLFECEIDEIVYNIQKDISIALSTTTFERFGKKYPKPVPINIVKKGNKYQLYTSPSQINDINQISTITNEIFLKYKNHLKSYNNISISLSEKRKNTSI